MIHLISTLIPHKPVTQNLPKAGSEKTVPIPQQPLTLPSNFRHVFQTTDQMKMEFVKFLKTIFYRLDEKKVLSFMSKCLEDPQKTDEEIYNELMANIDQLKKKCSFLSKLWSLFVLKNGIGKQVAQLMKGFNKDQFHDYMEIYDRRYVNTIRKIAKLPLNGKIIAVCNNPEVNFANRLEAGATLSSYPYKQFVPLNDSDCSDPFLYPEKTHKPISDEVPDNSVDLIGCFGGLHHIPSERVDGFVKSLHSKLRPGGVILLREHNASNDNLKAIAAVVHTFVNAADGVKWEVEKKEVREFKSEQEWTQLMEKHGFKRISPDSLVLKDDPTENALFAFVKKPTTLSDLKQAIGYRNDCQRPKEGTRATWIEWGNVRYSKQYAQYLQNHHSYAFDSIGHLRQHWKYFYHFVKESLSDPDISAKHLLLSDNMVMNLFILMATTVQCSLGAVGSLPSALIARWKYGNKWRDVCHLTELEKFEARNEKEYADYLDHTPFYVYDYMKTLKEMWKVIRNSQESTKTKLISHLSAIPTSLGLIAKTVVCAPIKSFYTAEANREPDLIKILIADPQDELKGVIDRWEKDTSRNKNEKIEVIHQTPDGYKLVSLPRYRPFTKICGYLSHTKHLQILEIGSQKEVSIDVLVEKDKPSPQVEGARIVYEMKRLQDEEEKRYVTYQVNLCALKQFQQTIKLENIEYIHE